MSFRACTETNDMQLVTTRAKQRRLTGAGTAFRQNGKNTYENDSGDVAYRNKQGNCIDSFRHNRL